MAGSLVEICMTYYVYVLKNQAGKYYIGSTSNLIARLKQHNLNCVSATKNRGPYIVVYKEPLPDRATARKRENILKSYKGNIVFKRLLAGNRDPIV